MTSRFEVHQKAAAFVSEIVRQRRGSHRRTPACTRMRARALIFSAHARLLSIERRFEAPREARDLGCAPVARPAVVRRVHAGEMGPWTMRNLPSCPVRVRDRLSRVPSLRRSKNSLTRLYRSISPPLDARRSTAGRARPERARSIATCVATYAGCACVRASVGPSLLHTPPQPVALAAAQSPDSARRGGQVTALDVNKSVTRGLLGSSTRIQTRTPVAKDQAKRYFVDR